MSDKLQHGDYFGGGTEEQYRQLLKNEIDDSGSIVINDCLESGLIYSDVTSSLVFGWAISIKNEHTFEEFKQKCINTFKNQI